MKFQVTHTTEYLYSQPVSQCQSEARLKPRDHMGQHCIHSRHAIYPEISDYRERVDYFGNHVSYFTIQKAHTRLTVTAFSEITGYARQETLHDLFSCTWEEACATFQGPELLEAALYRMDSTRTDVNTEIHNYARQSFLPGLPLITVAEEINRRIHEDFSYEPGFTTVTTPLSTVLTHRRGVCQDFAHLAIACFRSFGLPARYVSGYLETTPPPGLVKLTGADASHAWFSVLIPGIGWVDFDPTNNCRTGERHITLAWGRDYSDVAPLKGLAVGGGEHTVNVAVDVTRLQ